MIHSAIPSRRQFLASTLGAGIALGQEPRVQDGQDATFTSDVNVVNLFAGVHKKSGEIVSNLTKDDFTLAEDSRPQAIKYFSRESGLPLTLGLLVDTSMSQRNLINEERTASYRFFDKVLRVDRDLAFLIHFDFDTELLQDLTSNKRSLERGLEQLELPMRQLRQSQQGGARSGRGGQYPTPGGGRQGGGTVLYDAILLASDEVTRKQKGRKALILLTDGDDTGSKVSLGSSIEAAQRADTLVYSILFEDKQSAFQMQMPGGMGGGGRRRGGGAPPPMVSNRPDGKKILQRISRETGGGFFEVSKKHPIDEIYARIQEELRNQYSIGYVSDRKADPGIFRKISLTARQKDMIVQTREGYYPEN